MDINIIMVDCFWAVPFTTKEVKTPVTLCRLGFPTRPDFEVGVQFA